MKTDLPTATPSNCEVLWQAWMSKPWNWCDQWDRSTNFLV